MAPVLVTNIDVKRLKVTEMKTWPHTNGDIRDTLDVENTTEMCRKSRLKNQYQADMVPPRRGRQGRTKHYMKRKMRAIGVREDGSMTYDRSG